MPSTYTVTNTGDNGGLNPAPGAGTGTLRQAIVDANAAASGTAANPDLIQFNIPTTDPGYNATTGAFTIAPHTRLPGISDSLVLNGYSQPGASQNTLLGPAALGSTDPVLHPGSYGDNAVLKIELNGANDSMAYGLIVGGNNITVEGLVINRFGGAGIYVSGTGDAIQGNFLGTDVTGTLALGNSGADILTNYAPQATIGGATPAARNLISAALNNYPYGPAPDDSGGFGIFFNGAYDQDVAQGNFIGTDITGRNSLGNAKAGIGFDANLEYVTANVISGNNGWGIVGPGGGVFQGNFIGTDVTGTKPLGNPIDGIFGVGGTFGGSGAGAGNLISGNVESGIRGVGNNSVISGNFIGTDVTGSTRLGNGVGINFQDGGNNNIIGGLDTNAPGGPLAGGGNLISGNGNPGIDLPGSGASGNVVEGNYIGTDLTGTHFIGNGQYGTAVNLGPDASGNTIGGTTAASRNIISASDTAIGIGPNASNNVVEGNYIGVDATGSYALGNNNGVEIDGGNNNVIGGTNPCERNVISGSRNNGVVINAGSGNVVEGNYIGTDATGSTTTGTDGKPLGNANVGAAINNLGATGNTIGGTIAGAGNLISGNGWSGEAAAGVLLGFSSSGNSVQGNSIVGNVCRGVVLDYSSFDNTLGGTGAGAGNAVSGNGGDGVYVGPSVGSQGNPQGGIAFGNSILGNSIHDNAGLGIHLASGANDNQEAPVLTTAYTTSGGTIVTGTLQSVASTTFRIEFFANTTADPSGYGQGRTFLGYANVTTDLSGNATFPATLPALPTGQTVLSATATKLVGTSLTPNDTSQFARDVSIPVVSAITAPLAPVAVNTAVNASASFTDAIPSTTHTAVWNWGDNTTSAGTVTQTSGSGTVTGSHTFTTDGVYTITLTVTNYGGGSGQSVFQYVVIYNPSAGFVTGGGWFTSPAGAYAANPSLTGQANFGLNAKYKSGSTVPTGNTEFQFPAANLNFHATSYDWLVITTNQAQYQGSGTINGSGNFGFLVTAQDNGGTTPDLFRMKIWDKNSNNAVVYDTQPGAANTAAPTTALGGGRIQIHTNAQLVAGGANPSAAIVDPLTPAELQPIVQEAIARWQVAGIGPAQLSVLSQVTVGIAEFPGPWLGMAFPGAIWIDRTAAGYGWFIDPSTAADSVFPAAPGNPAYGKVDLLTVVEHELGHELGFDDNAGDGLMGVFLGTGVRRVPAVIYSGSGQGGTAPVLLGAALSQPTITLTLGQGQVGAAVAHLLPGEGMGSGTLPPAPPDATTAWLGDWNAVPGQTNARGAWSLMSPLDGLASVKAAVFAWMGDGDSLLSDPFALSHDVL